VAQLRRRHLKVARQRADFHHKTALSLTRRYGLIAHEDLHLTGVVRSRRPGLAKSTLDAGWGGFLSILGYKAEGAGVRVVAVPPYNTSQACSACGALPATSRGRSRIRGLGVAALTPAGGPGTSLGQGEAP
jgi:putative transposase